MTDAASDDPGRSPYRAETSWRPAGALVVTLIASLAPILVGIVAVLAENHGLVSAGGQLQGDGPPSLSSPGCHVDVEWTVEGRRGRVEGTVVELPFLDLERKRT